MNEEIERKKFEEWISRKPYCRMVERWPISNTNAFWSGQYKEFLVEMTWKAWQEAIKQQTK